MRGQGDWSMWTSAESVDFSETARHPIFLIKVREITTWLSIRDRVPELASEAAGATGVSEFMEATGACSEGFPFKVNELMAQL